MGKTKVKENQVTIDQAISCGLFSGILTMKCLSSYVIMSVAEI